MTKPIRLDDEAQEELQAAVQRYEKERPGLGQDLLESVGEAFGEIERRLATFPIAPTR